MQASHMSTVSVHALESYGWATQEDKIFLADTGVIPLADVAEGHIECL